MDTPPPPAAAPQKGNVALAVIAYIGILAVISYLLAKDDSYVKFHARQGLVLLIIEVIVWVVFSTFWMLWPLWQIVNLAVLVLSILGIINAAQGKEKELPLVGRFASHIPV
jgi:uncharacterized membrane protein